MIEYFTALVLSYTLHNHEIDTVVWFESEQHCMKAMSSRTFDHFYDHIYELYGNDISMFCFHFNKIVFIFKIYSADCR